MSEYIRDSSIEVIILIDTNKRTIHIREEYDTLEDLEADLPNLKEQVRVV